MCERCGTGLDHPQQGHTCRSAPETGLPLGWQITTAVLAVLSLLLGLTTIAHTVTRYQAVQTDNPGLAAATLLISLIWLALAAAVLTTHLLWNRATRRLTDWFNSKFNREVTHELLLEKVYARLQPSGGGTPDVDFLRAIRTNLRYHMSYISHLADRRRWLAGEELSFADLAAAAHLSSVDYLGEVPWEEFAVAKVWYARLKSRRAFRTILADRVPGALPSAHYADLDF